MISVPVFLHSSYFRSVVFPITSTRRNAVFDVFVHVTVKYYTVCGGMTVLVYRIVFLIVISLCFDQYNLKEHYMGFPADFLFCILPVLFLFHDKHYIHKTQNYPNVM